MSPTKRTAKSAAPASKAGDFPRRIFGIASPHSLGGVSMFEGDAMITSDAVAHFDSDPELVAVAVQRLADAGFEVLAANTAMINIAGSRTTWEKAFGTELVTDERPVIKPGGVESTATYIDTVDTALSGYVDMAGSAFEDVLEGAAIEEPYYPMASALPPTVDSWHLSVPDGVATALRAHRPHRSGWTGKGVRVAMVDTGWFRHPFFTEHGYRADQAVLAPGAASPDTDESGHGTGESANIFAAAPDVHLLPVKAADASGALVNMTAAFNAAVALSPDIITNSWGADVPTGPLSAARQAQAAAIAAAVAQGIVVCFSAGNGHWGFPGQHPDVISVGGVFRDEDDSLRASDYASGFVSTIYPGRQVPDVCGLVGMRPGANYIMLPVQDGDQIDQAKAAGTPPDGTTGNDGWALFSGTSAACPQIAGVVALMKQACSRLTPEAYRQILKDTAIDITAGSSNPNTPGTAGPGPDTATGHGLVDAARAVAIARLRCMGPILPIVPIGPILPIRPILPVLPIRPVFPLRPIVPIVPILPIRPLVPIIPLVPIRPFLPPPPFEGAGATDAAMATDPGPTATDQLSEDEVAYLGRMVIEDGDDLLGEL